MVLGYGHDDRVCAYTSLMAILDVEDVEYTSCCILVDKEEIGSVGATGMHSTFYESAIMEICELLGKNSLTAVNRVFKNSRLPNNSRNRH